jgi:hypothetical protein
MKVCYLFLLAGLTCVLSASSSSSGSKDSLESPSAESWNGREAELGAQFQEETLLSLTILGTSHKPRGYKSKSERKRIRLHNRWVRRTKRMELKAVARNLILEGQFLDIPPGSNSPRFEDSS